MTATTVGNWLVAAYRPTALFTLKPAGSTSSGGKSLLVPTPFAVKMALLDVALRIYGLTRGQILFPAIRNLRLALSPPRQAVVNNAFVKIMRPHKSGTKDVTGTGLETPMGNTIAFREYISYQGEMSLAFQGMSAKDLIPLLWQINYFGKRGGFFQLTDAPRSVNYTDVELRQAGYTIVTESVKEFSVDGILQMLDDCGPKMTFEHANIYSGKAISLDKERVLRHVVIPYRLKHSSKSYTFFERINN